MDAVVIFPGILPAVFLLELSGRKVTESADKRADSHSAVRGSSVGSGNLPAKRLWKPWNLCKTGSNHVHYIRDCVDIL